MSIEIAAEFEASKWSKIIWQANAPEEQNMTRP